MSTTNTNKADKRYARAEIKGKILHLKTENNLLVKCIDKLISTGDHELLAQLDRLCIIGAQDPNSVYTSQYRIGFKHGKIFGTKAVEGIPSMPFTASGRCALVAYCRGMMEALELQVDELELELQTHASAHADGTRDTAP